MDGKIKPCKKCGELNWSTWCTGRTRVEWHYVMCENCEYQTEYCKTEEEAIEAWNKVQGE